MSLKKINQLFNFEKGVLQSSKCIEGEYDFITAAADWKTHNEYSHDCEALIFAAAASGSLGRTHYVNGKFISSDLCFILTPKEPEKLPVDLKFYHIIFNLYKNEIVAATKAGTSKEAIGLKVFGDYELPYFDISIQHKVKAEFGKAEALKNGLIDEYTYQLTQLENLNQAILQEAVQGKLVKQDTKDEPASELLKRIKAEKEALIKAKKLKSGKSTDQSVSYIDEYQIPKSWIWCKTDDIFFVTKLAGFEYTEHIKLQEVGEIPVVRAQNVRPLEIDKTNLLYIDREVSQLLDRCSLTKKCLLVTFIGAGIGDVATFKESERWHLAPNVAKMEPFEGCEEMVDVTYVNYFLMSKIGQRELFKHIKATAQPSLSMGTIRDIDIPLPPLSEQKRIVAEIEKQLAKTKQLKEHIIANQQATEQLLKALLHQAFEVREVEKV